jgi:Protein-tyrosine-phosphatase-like, N-terminal domain
MTLPMDPRPDDPPIEHQIETVAGELAREFAAVPEPTVRRIVKEAYGSFSSARIVTFLPILVRRAARARLITSVRPAG